MDLLTLRVKCECVLGQEVYSFDVEPGHSDWFIPDKGAKAGRTQKVFWNMAAFGWDCEIDEQKQQIICDVVDSFRGGLFDRKVLPLQAGTIVLNQVYGYKDPDDNILVHVSFRSPELQEFMDKYNIHCIRRVNPNQFYTRMGDWDEPVAWITDGKDEQLIRCDTTAAGWRIFDATWALAEVLPHPNGRSAYILYAKKRISAAMEQSFLEHGIKPVSES